MARPERTLRRPGAPASASVTLGLASRDVEMSPSSSPGSNEGVQDGERQGLYTTGDMARLTSNTLRTVRFYEEAGILRPARRTEGGHRLFAHAELERLRLASDMREAGLSLDDIRSLLELKQGASTGGEAAHAAVASLQKHLKTLRSKVEVLGRLAVDLEATIDHAGTCLGCDEPELFPDRCGSCHRLQDQGPPPRAMRVMWDMPADPPPRASHPDAAGGASPGGASPGGASPGGASPSSTNEETSSTSVGAKRQPPKQVPPVGAE